MVNFLKKMFFNLKIKNRLVAVFAVIYALLLLVSVYLLPGVFGAILCLFLIVFSAVFWGLAGGLISTVWSGSLMAVSTFYLRLSTLRGFLFGTFAYFIIAVGVGMLSDAIKKKQMELENNEIFLRHSQEAAGIGSIILDFSSNELQASETFYKLYGIEEKDKYLRKALVEVIRPDYRDIVLKAYDKTAEKGDGFDQEYIIIRKNDGEERWIHGLGKVLKDEYGKPIRIIGAILDITVRKQKEEELYTRNRELTALNSLSAQMRIAKKSKKLLKIILNETCNILYSEDGMIMLLTKDKKRFKVVEAKGHWRNSIGRTISIKERACDIMTNIDTNYFCDNCTQDTLQLENAITIDHVMFTPIKLDRKLLGILAIHRWQKSDNKPFSNINIRFLTTIGEVAGIALHRQMLHENTRKSLKELQSQKNIDEAITTGLDIHVIYNVILDEITKNINYSAAAILRLEKHTGFLKYEAWRGFNVYDPENMHFHLNEGYANQTASTLKTLHIPNLQDIKNDSVYMQLIKKEGFISYHNEPLIIKGRLQGVLEIFGRRPFDYDKDLSSFFKTLANHTSVAINNADLFYNLELSNIELLSAYESTIEGWAYALDLKDEETKGHSSRVTEMTILVAKKFGIKDEELAHIKRGALLHDIGKMGIPDSILLKPGKLTDEEWAVMQKHPEYAFKMLSNIAFLHPALDIPYCHHEKWDGTGYPRGLRGNKIPMAARIFAVIDVYDALTSNRPYRKAWPNDQALSHIQQQAGKHFDPDVVKGFLSILKQDSNVYAE